MTNTRSLTGSFEDWVFYRSTFNMDTGTIVREVESRPNSIRRDDWEYGILETLALTRGLVGYTSFQPLLTNWASKYGRDKKWVSKARTNQSFSPIPETIDIQITNWCNMGCSYCYMGSTEQGSHAPKKLLKAVFDGLDAPPYQIAFGGGEPTAHPEFPWFLRHTREQGTVPNFTTAGHFPTPKVIEATNEFAGGVALTYHRALGIKKFANTFKAWSSKLSPRVQMNIHVLFDDHVAESLRELVTHVDDFQRDKGRRVVIVLLAYYPDIGRSTLEGLPSKPTYMVKAPIAIKEAERHFGMAFSEGLLPYFLSRDLLPTVSAARQEGVYSCYVDREGKLSRSSFDPPSSRSPDVYEDSFQDVWNRAAFAGYDSSSCIDACDRCPHTERCYAPNIHHALICSRAEHNKSSVQSLVAQEHSAMDIPEKKK